MSERTSKFILAAEALLLVLPVTFLFLLWGSDEIFRPAEYGGFVNRIIGLLAGIALISGWWLMAAFWRHGASALRNTYAAVWVAAACGGSASIIAGVLLWATQDRELQKQFGVLVFGIPLLIPFAHVYVERLMRTGANKPLKERRTERPRLSPDDM